MATILVADDDQLLRAIIRDHLERAGHTVLEAGDGIAAIDIALDERPECLLLDVMMPLARGLEVVRRVRQEAGWHPTIAMISARTRVTDRLNALDAGADVYFEKPFEPDVLLAVVERRLTQAAPSRIVDVLGPIWTAVAIERLARDAVARRTAGRVDTGQVEELFADLVGRSIGRFPALDLAAAGGSADALRLIWEDTLRALLRDAGDQPIPMVTNLAGPDAVAAVERLIGHESLARHRAALSGHPTSARSGAGRIQPAAGRPDGAGAVRWDSGGNAWTRTLRRVLGGGGAGTADLTGAFRGALGEILRDDSAPRVVRLDPLQTLWLALAEHDVGSRRVKEPA